MHGSAAPPTQFFEAFGRLPERHRSAIEQLARSHVRELAARRDLLREGEKPSGVRLILDGWACRYKQLPDGRRQIVHLLLPGDFCDAGHLAADRLDHSVCAITRLVYAELPGAEFEALAGGSPDLLRALWRHEMIDAAIAREWTANVGQRTAYERLAHLFCETVLRLSAVKYGDPNVSDSDFTERRLEKGL